MIISSNGLIHDIGPSSDLTPKYSHCTFTETIDCSGKSIIPGLVDAHTHAVFSGDRIHEFIMKLEGKTYLDIHKAGGGIYFTVNHTRESSEQELLGLLLERLERMGKLGTTTVEVKSGYGLTKESEAKMLKVIKMAKKITKLDLVANYCGAHSVPKGMNQDEATEEIIKNHIPYLKELMEKGEIDPEFIDIFAEVGVFEFENTKKILAAGKTIGLKGNFHGDEIGFVDSGKLGFEAGARAISHLENLNDEGIQLMAKGNIAGVLLPTTQHLLKLNLPPVRKMIKEGVIVALGSDFNPNAYCYSMGLTMNLACVNYKMTPNESLVASTLNSAASIDRSGNVGSLEKGKFADFVIINEKRWEHIIYQFGDLPIWRVYKKGVMI